MFSKFTGKGLKITVLTLLFLVSLFFVLFLVFFSYYFSTYLTFIIHASTSKFVHFVLCSRNLFFTGAANFSFSGVYHFEV